MLARALIFGAGVGFLAGCFIGAGNFAGKGCDSNLDCPDPYVCAQVRPPGRTCELVPGINNGGVGGGSGGGSGGGTGGGGGVSVPPDWCHDVKPIFLRTCISNCHGNDQSMGPVPHAGHPYFRLDVYADGGMPNGAYDLASTIKVRVTADDMPPATVTDPNLRPSASERTLIIKWVNTGATECNDAGSATTDAGNPDAGKPDGG